MGGRCGMHERREMHTSFWRVNLNGRDVDVDGSVILKWILKK
jgi:hypothetical protein